MTCPGSDVFGSKHLGQTVARHGTRRLEGLRGAAMAPATTALRGLSAPSKRRDSSGWNGPGAIDRPRVHLPRIQNAPPPHFGGDGRIGVRKSLCEELHGVVAGRNIFSARFMLSIYDCMTYLIWGTMQTKQEKSSWSHQMQPSSPCSTVAFENGLRLT